MEVLSEGTSLAAKQMLPRVLKHFPCVFIIATIVKDRESDLVCKMGLFNNWQLRPLNCNTVAGASLRMLFYGALSNKLVVKAMKWRHRCNFRSYSQRVCFAERTSCLETNQVSGH